MNPRASDTLVQFIHLPVFLAVALILLFLIALPVEIALEHVYEPSYLLFTLNAIFITAVSFWISWQALRGFLASGLIPMLVLGCALLSAGSAATLAGLLIKLPDEAVTVYNLGFLLSATLHYVNAILLERKRVETAAGSRKPISASAYLLVFLIVGGIWAACRQNLMPRYYVPEVGPEAFSDVILTVAILLLGISAYRLGVLARQKQAGYLRWYGYGLALIALGLFGDNLGVPGSPLDWSGRATQYLGNLYLLAAAFHAFREARSKGLGWEDAVREFFRESEGRYRTLVESARSAIVSVDRKGRIFLWNPSAEKLFGYAAGEAMGQVVTELIAPPGSREALEGLIRTSPRGVHELTLRRRGGGEFDAEFTVYGLTGRDEKSLNIRDITERKRAEQALQEANEMLEQRVRERTAELLDLTVQLEKSRRDLRHLASELVLAEERERKQIAVVLHDEIAQNLAAVRMRHDMLAATKDEEASRRVMAEAKSLLQESIQRTRSLMMDLANPLLSDMGLEAACRSLAGKLMETHPLRIHCDIRDTYRDLDPDLKTILFQVIREMLNNVVKHSRARNARVTIDMEDGVIRAGVRDDGRGLDAPIVEGPTAEGGFGLFSIRERLAAFGGSLQIESSPGKGTVVTATLPVAPDRFRPPRNGEGTRRN